MVVDVHRRDGYHAAIKRLHENLSITKETKCRTRTTIATGQKGIGKEEEFNKITARGRARGNRIANTRVCV